MLNFTAQDWPYLDDEQRLELIHNRLSGLISRRAYLEVRKRQRLPLPPGIAVALTKRSADAVERTSRHGESEGIGL